MNPELELREVIVQLKTILTAYGEMGLDLLLAPPGWTRLRRVRAEGSQRGTFRRLCPIPWMG